MTNLSVMQVMFTLKPSCRGQEGFKVISKFKSEV
jgi:hypothetical protein